MEPYKIEKMITGNEPAMHQIVTDIEAPGLNNTYSYGGLTIRQYFAAMAMQGILANAEFLINYQASDIHEVAVINADALIAELNKEK